MSETIASTRASACLALLALFTACESGTTTTEPPAIAHQNHAALAATSPLGGGGGKSLLKKVHSSTARFHSTKQAERAGYVADPVCVESPAGGMGHHWMKQSLVDPVFDPLNPEVLLYAPDKNGKLKLVAVEYIVTNTGQTAPTFNGQAFDAGGAPVQAAHWSLHVWFGMPNPSGLHAPFNPDVDCP